MSTSPYTDVGGEATFRRLSEAFYARVAADPLLRPLYPKHLRCAVDGLALFLTELFGGPPVYTMRRGTLGLPQVHERFAIGEPEREHWLAHMAAALDAVGIPEHERSDMRQVFAEASAWLMERVPSSGAPGAQCVLAPGVETRLEDVGRDCAADGDSRLQRPRINCAGGAADGDTPVQARLTALAQIWPQQRALEELLEAVRRGRVAEALALASGPDAAALSHGSLAAAARTLAALIASAEPALVECAATHLRANPRFARDPNAGTLLLHSAAGAWAVEATVLLVELGADPNAPDPGGHSALYGCANRLAKRGDTHADGARVVRLLVSAGADVDAACGSKRCTALHMAARRGNLAIAEALLDCGAAIDAQDSAGVTPLRRALNCRQPHVAAALAARGAQE